MCMWGWAGFHWFDSGNHDIIMPPSHLSFQTEHSYLAFQSGPSAFLSLCILLNAKHVRVMDAHACLKRLQVCNFDLWYSEIWQSLLSIKLDLWNSYMELLPLNSTVILNTENLRFSENNNDWDFFPNCFAKLTKVNLATVCLRNKMNSHEKKWWRKYGFKFFGGEKWKINTGALACFTLLHQSEWIHGKRRS